MSAESDSRYYGTAPEAKALGGLAAALEPLPAGVLVLARAQGRAAPFAAYLNAALRRMAGLGPNQTVAGADIPALLLPENPAKARQMLEEGLDGNPPAPCVLRLQAAGRDCWVRMEANCAPGMAYGPYGPRRGQNCATQKYGRAGDYAGVADDTAGSPDYVAGARSRQRPAASGAASAVFPMAYTPLLYCVFTDLTAQIEAEAAVTRQAEYQRSLFDMLPAGIVRFRLEVASHTAVCLYANRTARFFDGVNPAARSSDFFARLQHLVHPEDLPRLLGMLGQIWAGVSRLSFDLRMRAGERMQWVRGVVCRTRGEQGDVLYQAVYEDVTALRQAITALAAAEQATAAKNDFLSKVSHELRTPLGGILGLTNLLKAEPHLGESVRHQVAQIDDCGRQLLALVNDILDLSQLENGQLVLHPEWYDYEEFRHGLRRAVAPVYAARGLHLVSDSHPRGLPVVADRARLHQVFFILLCAAAARTPEGGTVHWACHSKQQDGFLQAAFSLRDGGPALPKAELDALFIPFAIPSESGRPGAGVALALALALVQAMDGALQAHNSTEGGLVFDLQLSLPLAPPRKVVPNLAGRTVLVVEDHPVNRMIVGRQLATKGIRVLTAANGAEGVQAFSRAAPGSIDAVLMDLRMPVMDGFAATRAIRALPRPDAATVPILAMTANDSAQDRAQSMAAGMDAHLAKPLEPSLLFHTLEEKLPARPGDETADAAQGPAPVR